MTVAREPYYITTHPLPPSQGADLASVREWICADVVARHQRAMGHDVRLVVSSLEQGRDAERAAYERGATVEDHAKEAAERHEAMLAAVDVQCDAIIRTTEPRHQHVAKALFLKLFDQGDIYKASVKSRHCGHCKEYVAPANGDEHCACPHCGRPTTEADEECFFLRTCKYQKAVLDHIASHPEFVVPADRVEALVATVADKGVADLRISRAATEWAIPVPINPRHAIDPAFNTLITYLTGSGYLADPQMFERYWPPRLQTIPARTLDEHVLAWPAMLMAIGLPLPEKLLVRGELEWKPMASGNAVGASGDPAAIAARTGADMMRLAALSLGPCTEDGAMLHGQLLDLGNERLAEELGALVSTTVAAIVARRSGAVPRPGALREPEKALVDAASALRATSGAAIESLDFAAAIDHAWAVVGMGLGYAEKRGILGLAEGDAEPRRMDTVLYVLAEVCRLVAHSLKPLLPGGAARIEARLGIDYDGQPPAMRHKWGLTQPHTAVQDGPPLFPRIVLPVE